MVFCVTTNANARDAKTTRNQATQTCKRGLVHHWVHHWTTFASFWTTTSIPHPATFPIQWIKTHLRENLLTTSKSTCSLLIRPLFHLSQLHGINLTWALRQLQTLGSCVGSYFQIRAIYSAQPPRQEP